jgi:putative intracellular protease/amidase
MSLPPAVGSATLSRMRRLLYPLAGAVGALLLWLIVTVPLALRVLHIDPVDPVADIPPPPPAFDLGRPTAAVLLSQAGTEITDFLAPWAILSASGAFNVVAVAADAGVAPTNGRLGIVPPLTLDGFDAAHRDGADVGVIPNILDPDHPAVGAWLKAQQTRGAALASICEGARVLAHNGLLDGHAATTHFAALDELAGAHPDVRWQRDVRFVDDGGVVSSAGVTAGIDAALHLVERVAGRDVAQRTAAALALPAPRDPTLASPHLGAGELAGGVLNGAYSWPKTRGALQLAPGIDELAVAAVLDAYPRSFAAGARSLSPGRAAVVSRHGLLLVPVGDAHGADDDLVIVPDINADRGFAFDRALGDIARRYDGTTAALVAAQLEYDAARLPAGGRAYRAGPIAALIVVLLLGALASWWLAARGRRSGGEAV